MPKVACNVSPKGPFGAKEPPIIGLFYPKGAFRRKMTYEDKAPYASTPACTQRVHLSQTAHQLRFL